MSALAMNRVHATDLPRFLKQFRLTGGAIRRVKLRHSSDKSASVEFRLTVREPIVKLGDKPKKDAPPTKSPGSDRPVAPVTSVAPKGKLKNKPA